MMIYLFTNGSSVYEAPLTESSPKMKDVTKSSFGTHNPTSSKFEVTRTEYEGQTVEQPLERSPNSSQVLSAPSISIDSSDPIYRAVFGDTDEELSEISDAEFFTDSIRHNNFKKVSEGSRNKRGRQTKNVGPKFKKETSKPKRPKKAITKLSADVTPRRSPRLKEKYSQSRQWKQEKVVTPSFNVGDPGYDTPSDDIKIEESHQALLSPIAHGRPVNVISSEDFFVAPRVKPARARRHIRSPSPVLTASQVLKIRANDSSNESEFTTPTKSKPIRSYANEVLAGAKQKRKRLVADNENSLPESGVPAKKRYKPDLLATFASYLPDSNHSFKSEQKRINQNNIPSSALVASTSKTPKALGSNRLEKSNLAIRRSPRTNNITVKEQLALIESRNSLKNSFAQRSSSIDANHAYKETLPITGLKQLVSTASQPRAPSPIINTIFPFVIDQDARADCGNVSSAQLDGEQVSDLLSTSPNLLAPVYLLLPVH
jgi:hypothetical protein